MRTARSLYTLLLASLASCNLPIAPPQQGVSIDCRHFYRNTAGVWQADGNATAFVNGRQWFLGIQQFTPTGPVVGGQGGRLLYNDIQRQCGGGLPAVAATPVSPRADNKRCYADGDQVTLSGRITYRTVPPDLGDGLPGHHYARMTLDRPVCMRESFVGAVPAGRTVAIVPEGNSPELGEGMHVTVKGKLFAKSTSNEPPEPLQLNTAL